MRGGNSGVSTLVRPPRPAEARWIPVWPAYAAAIWVVTYVVWVFLDIAGHVLSGDYMVESMLAAVLADSVLRAVSGILILATMRSWRFTVPDGLMLLLAWAAAGGSLAFPLYKTARFALAANHLADPWPAPYFTVALLGLSVGAALFVTAAVSFLNRSNAPRRWAILGLFLGFFVMYLPVSHW
ncbi:MULTISPECIES: hypothetical protein [unclassified Crossiella]|uniref:hypothetical protein n=1 Tax=unclassified Crossiella TaxID=2620835 RepID=UPI001FFE2EBB|nr:MULTISPECIES: hypothetical protein [unclassified Crossiella]MCK2242821.1 hypothetical protein [Crossiella sp. S99.2]MCK2256698.1 hypothetical protein [Crossiella sp. S99.1]